MSIKCTVIQKEEEELPFHMSSIPEFFQRKCEVELKETPEKKKQSIQDLRNLLTNDKTTKDICFHDDFLVQYLRHSKYNTNKAFNHLRNFIIFRNREAKLFESVPDEFFLTVPSTKFFTILPKRSPDGCSVILGQLGKWDPNELPVEDLKRIAVISLTQLLRDPMAQINGLVSIYDFAGTRFEHFKNATPANLYFLYYVAICCVPVRYKAVHILNPNHGFRLMWSIIKTFISDKIKDRVFFHSDTREILNHFPKSMIPVQYGGEILDMHATNFQETANKEQKKNTAAGQPNFF